MLKHAKKSTRLLERGKNRNERSSKWNLHTQGKSVAQVTSICNVQAGECSTLVLEILPHHL